MERQPNDTKRAYGNRAWAKCSACRKFKIKVSKDLSPRIFLVLQLTNSLTAQCTPRDRVWNFEMEEKCESCRMKNLPCGPNITRDEDPEVFKGRVEYRYASESDNTTGSPYDITSTASPSEFSGSLTMGLECQGLSSSNNKLDRDNTGRMCEAGDEQEGKGDLKAYSDEKLKVEALAKYILPRTLYDLDLITVTIRLNELNVLVECLIYQSHVSAKACEHLRAEQPYVSSFRARIHLLFVETYRIALELNKRDQEDRVLRILFPLISALDKNPSLYDSLKRDPLLKIAGIFQQFGHDWESERLLRKASSIQDTPPPVASDMPSTLLAKSLSKTSKTMRLVLGKVFQITLGCDSVPAELMITKLHRAAQEQNANVVTAIWLEENRSCSSAAIPNQSDMSSSVDPRSSCRDQVDHGLDVEAKDFRYRTALFLAADTGLSGGCFFLLYTTGADPNVRDSCGHTMLEIAAMGGHLQVVEYLVAAGAIVNPEMTFCASSPLQAAVESDHSHAALVDCLLAKGANPHVRRLFDSKNAIEIAEEKGFHQLAQRMQSVNDQQPPFSGLEIQSFAN